MPIEAADLAGETGNRSERLGVDLGEMQRRWGKQETNNYFKRSLSPELRPASGAANEA